MADAPKLLGTDTLRKAYPKLNQAIDNSNEALSTSNTAKNTANSAKSIADTALANSENTQTQLDTLVINGDSSVEAAQARVDAEGTSYSTLQERLNKADKYIADVSVNVNSMPGTTIDQQIKNAFNKATSNGTKFVMIPAKTKFGGDWQVNEAIQIPSNCTLILNGCHLKLAAGVQDNIIVNSGARTSPLTANQNIHIVGIGNAIVDGQADINKNFGDLTPASPYYNDHRRIGINLFNVQNFSIRNFKVREPQGWGISIENGCRKGLVRDIEFESTNQVLNQDGLDIRRGCSDIIIENISGVTGDDMIALTTLNYDDGTGNTFQVGDNGNWGLNNNIENIKIRNVKGYCAGRHNLIRLLCKDGNQIKNVEIQNIEDTSTTAMSKGNAVVLIGSTAYSTVSDDVLGDIINIKIENVEATGNVDVIVFESNAQDVKLKDIRYLGNNGVALIFLKNDSKNYKNLKFENLIVEATNAPTRSTNPFLLYQADVQIENFFIKNVKATNTRYVMGSATPTVKVTSNMVIEDVMVDTTALEIFRFRNGFNQSQPSFIRNVKVKDITKIFTDTTDPNYMAGRYFNLSAYCYIEGFKHLLETDKGINLNNLGQGSQMKMAALAGATNFTGSNATFVIVGKEGVYFAKVKGEYTHSSTFSATPSTGVNITSFTTSIKPVATVRRTQFAFGTDFRSLLGIVGTNSQISVRSASGGNIDGLKTVYLDLEFEVSF